MNFNGTVSKASVHQDRSKQIRCHPGSLYAGRAPAALSASAGGFRRHQTPCENPVDSGPTAFRKKAANRCPAGIQRLRGGFGRLHATQHTPSAPAMTRQSKQSALFAESSNFISVESDKTPRLSRTERAVGYEKGKSAATGKTETLPDSIRRNSRETGAKAPVSHRKALFNQAILNQVAHFGSCIHLLRCNFKFL